MLSWINLSIHRQTTTVVCVCVLFRLSSLELALKYVGIACWYGMELHEKLPKSDGEQKEAQKPIHNSTMKNKWALRVVTTEETIRQNNGSSFDMFCFVRHKMKYGKVKAGNGRAPHGSRWREKALLQPSHRNVMDVYLFCLLYSSEYQRQQEVEVEERLSV